MGKCGCIADKRDLLGSQMVDGRILEDSLTIKSLKITIENHHHPSRILFQRRLTVYVHVIQGASVFTANVLCLIIMFMSADQNICRSYHNYRKNFTDTGLKVNLMCLSPGDCLSVQKDFLFKRILDYGCGRYVNAGVFSFL